MKIMHSMALIAIAIAALALSVPARAAKTDSDIITAARKSYVFRNYLQGDEIKIEAKDGAVTLTGMVSEIFDKDLVQATIVDIPGVKTVDNRLELKGAAPTANSDEWLRAKVKATLRYHRSVNTSTVEVEVKDGVATLKGIAITQAQKELTTEYAKDIEGIKDANNEMTVANPSKKTARTASQKIDDASITAQIKMALLLHHSTSSISTTVSTNKRVVSIGGKAKNEAEKDLVTKLVNDVNGVKSVKNQMTIE